MRSSIQRIKSLVVQENHKAGCQCGFCKNKGNIQNLLKGKKKADKPQDEEPEEPTAMQEGRDDINTLGLSKPEKDYARMSTKKAMSGDKPQMFMDMVASVTNQEGRKKGFGIEDKGETTAGKKLESRSVRTVKRLLD